MRTLDEAIKLAELRVEACEATISRCDLNDPREKDVAQDNREYAENQRQLAKWLKQLQKIQGIVKEYYYTPTEVMDCSDAFNMIREVVEEKK